MLKGDQKLTIKVEGNGPIGPILVDAHANGDVRGYVTNPHVDFEGTEQGKLRVYQAVGTEGFVTVIKDIGMREPFIGQSPIVSGELGEDFTYYFAVSEQTPSSVGVGVLVNGDDSILAAGGFILQIMRVHRKRQFHSLKSVCRRFLLYQRSNKGFLQKSYCMRSLEKIR